MKIAQITDLHIGLVGQETYNVDVRDNFLIILGEVVFDQPDLIVVTGDLCFDQGDLGIYKWIKDKLDNTTIPYLVLPGNHDDAKMMMEVFEIDFSNSDEEIYFAKKLAKTTALFLDNSQAQHSENQKKWLKRQLHQADKNLLIFTHYPPVKCKVEFMDKNYALKDTKDILDIFHSFEKNIYLFCGHYHTEKIVHIDNLHMAITPSTYMQINPNSTDFEVESYLIGYRLIELSKSKCMSRVKYIEGKKMI
jgi:Icc protein